MHDIYNDIQTRLPTDNPQAHVEAQRKVVYEREEEQKANTNAFDLLVLAREIASKKSISLKSESRANVSRYTGTRKCTVVQGL